MPGIYVHIPFCQSRCIYCDFFSTTSLAERDTYIDALCREISLRSRQEPGCEIVRTIYVGGGTPSQLTPQQIGRILDCIYTHFDVDAQAEVTLEANPDDINETFLGGLQPLPVNRLSLGIQTFDDARLRFLHRRHTAAEAIRAVKLCQSHGYRNLSIDLMFGFPDETPNDWQRDLQQALQLHVQHLSAYSLMWEDGTPLTRMLQQGKIREPEEETTLEMFRLLMRRLQENGFEHYEISNFCRPGYQSRHNSSYWHNVPYIGFGAGAHSYDGHTRSWNVASLPIYIKGINEGNRRYESETLTDDQRFNERVMTGLRTAEGISLRTLQADFGETYYRYFMHACRQHLTSGNLQLSPDRQRIHLSADGILISDTIMSDLMRV